MGTHDTEPRDVGYSNKAVKYYKEWIEEQQNFFFLGERQKDLFIFAMALGKNREQKAEIGSKKINNIPVSAISEKQKWALLSIGVSEENGLLSLKDESSMYQLAEAYANEGIEILASHMEKYGFSYPKELSLELKKMLDKKE